MHRKTFSVRSESAYMRRLPMYGSQDQGCYCLSDAGLGNLVFTWFAFVGLVLHGHDAPALRHIWFFHFPRISDQTTCV